MNQKDEERLIMDYFRKIYPHFPKGKLMKSESPDFILQQNNHQTIGIEITRLHDANIPKSNPGFPVAKLNYTNLEAAIKRKEEKLTLYRQKKINVFWLIITTDFIDRNASVNVTNFLSGFDFKTQYQKVFLFDLFDRKIFEVSTK